MKRLLGTVMILVCALCASAQYLTVTNLSGTAVYGATSVTVTSSGSASSIPYCGVNPYWIGASSGSVIPLPGSYTFTFSPAATAVRLYVTAMDFHLAGTDTEKIAIAINGIPYTLTLANLTTYAGTCGQPAATIIAGELDAVLDFGAGAGGQLDVAVPVINSCTVSTNGLDNGSTFTFQFIEGTGAINNGPVCVGDTLKLGRPGDSTGATYFWYGPAGFTSTKQNPFIFPAVLADSGTYHVVKTVGGLPDTAHTLVVIKPNPILVVSSNAPLCQGGANTLALFADPDSTGETFSWSGPAGFSSTLQNPTITGFVAADTGYYTVIAIFNGCTSKDSTHVILAPIPPAPVISGDTVYCTGETFVPFTVAATGTILWYATGTGGTGSATPIAVSTTTPGTTIVWASQTVLGCESLRDSIVVVVHPTPAAPAVAGTTVYCQYQSYIPPAVTGINILWYLAATGGAGSVTPPILSTAVPGTYSVYVTQTDTGCESPRAPFTITVNPKPIPPVVADVPANYCPGQPFVPFTIISGVGVLWYDFSTGGAASASPPTINTNIPGSDTVWVTQTLLGCESDRAPFVVTVYDSVISSFTYDIRYGCSADTVVFTNTSYQATDFLWTFGDTKSSIVKNPVHVYNWQGIDSVLLYSRTANCIDSSSAIINLVHPIHARFVVDTAIICQGKTVTFTDSSVGTTLSYFWNFADDSTTTIPSPSHFYPHTGVYKVYEVVTDFVPCHDTMYKTIYVDSISPINIAITDSVLCRSTSTTVTGLYTNIGNTGVVWTMGNGDSIGNENPLQFGYDTTGTFTITATALYRACENISTSRSVTILPQPAIFIGSDTTICKGSGQLTLMDSRNAGNPVAKWLWNTGATSSAIIVVEPGDYSATVNMNGCMASASVKVANDCYMNIPNVFTPNGDGMNDYFYPRQFLSSGLISFNMNIYNRWGELIFETNSPDGAGWDGKFNNISQPSGVYVYIIDGTFKDGQKEHHQGNVTLLR